MSPNLQDIPLEILTHLSQFCSLSDLNCWAKTNKFFLSIFNSVLYQRNLHPNVFPPLTCLYWAIYTNNPETLKRAVSFGADLNMDLLRKGTDHDDGITLRMVDTMYYPIPGSSTLLNLAVCLRHEQVVRFLVENSAELNAERPSLCDCQSVSSTIYPLHEALVHINNPSIAKLLVNGGARLSAPGLPGLFDAVGHNMTLFYALVDKKVDINQKDGQNKTLLHHAVRNQCSPDFILKLIELGLPINDQSNIGQTALEYMTPSDVFAPTAIHLLDAGADPHLGANSAHISFLHKALSNPFTHNLPNDVLAERARDLRRLVMRLCSAGFDAHGGLSEAVSPHTSRGSALFLAACNTKDLDCMSMLLRAGANVHDSVFYRESTQPDAPEHEESILAALIRHDFEDFEELIRLDQRIPEVFSPIGRIHMLLEHGARLDRGIHPHSPSPLERVIQTLLCLPLREWEMPATAGLPAESHHLMIMVLKAQRKNLINQHINSVMEQCLHGVVSGHTILRTAGVGHALSALALMQSRLYPGKLHILDHDLLVPPPQPVVERKDDDSSESSSEASDDVWEGVEEDDEQDPGEHGEPDVESMGTMGQFKVASV